MEIINIKISELKPAEYNPRAMTEKEAADLTESIKRFGIVDPFVVNKHAGRENVVIGGHQRLKIAQGLGHEAVPVVYVDLPLEKEQELNLRLNKNSGHWDWDMLANFDEKILLGVGFQDIELDKNFDLSAFDSEEYNFDYPFGTINSYARIGDYAAEIENEQYQRLKEKIEAAGGLVDFLKTSL